MIIKTLKNKILFFVIATILFLGVLTVLWIASYTSKSLLGQKKQEVTIELANMADRIKGSLDMEQHFVETIAHDTAVIEAMKNNGAPEQDNGLISYFDGLKARGGYEDILIYDSAGNVLLATDDRYLGRNFGYRSYFNQAMLDDFATEVVINGVTNEPDFIFAHRILSQDGEILGMAVAITGVNSMNELLAGNMKDNTALVNMHMHMLVDNNGVVISSDNQDYMFKSLGQLDYYTLQSINTDKRYGQREIAFLQYGNLMEVVKKNTGLMVYDYYDEEDKGEELVGIAPVHTYPFHVAMEFQETSFRSQIAKIYYSLGIVILAVCLSLSILMYYLLSRFLLPLKQLKNAAEKIGQNDYNYVVSIKSGDELEELGTAFNIMGQGLIKSKNEVEERVTQQTKEIFSKQLELENQQKAVVNILEDITEEKEHSDKMAQDLKKFELAIENANDQITITDENGLIVYANPAMTKITGYSRQEVIGKTPAIWGKQMSLQYYNALWRTIKEKKVAYEGELYDVRKDGTIFLAHLHISPILDKKEEVKFFVGIVRDISKEREAQTQLRRDAEELKKANILIENQKERAESILTYLKSIGDGVLATDLNGKVVFFNEAAEKLTGISIAEAIGKKSNEVVLISEEKNAKFRRDLVKDALDGKIDLGTVGEHFRIKSCAGFFVAISITVSLIFDKNKKKQGCILVMRDVTEQREIEKTKDDFLSIAAHQLRTPLTGVRWSLEMLMDGDLGELPEEAKKTLENISENNRRLILLVNDLLDVSRINMGKAKEEAALVDPCKTLQEAIRALQGLTEERGSVIVYKEMSEFIPMVKMGPKHLFQSFENLLSNAVKYTPKGGSIKATVDYKKDKVVISIADEGIGIPKEDQPKIFSKFFRASNATLKETEGSGLGLNVVKSFIEEFGGNVSFESEEGKGTTFIIELPVDPS